MTFQELTKQTAAQHQRRFGCPPTWMAAAPGRVNIIGEHTDYNDGFVLPMAIERWTIIAAHLVPANQSSLHSEALDSTASFDPTRPLQRSEPHWADYARGVMTGFQRLGIPIAGFAGLLNSTVPVGSGLSSSAALEVATATLLEAVTGHRLDDVEKALLCQRAEHEFAGVPCGIMDQFTSTLAQADHLILLDCRSRTVEPVPMTDPAVAVLIVNTNVRHALTGGEYGQRRAQCETAARALGVAALRDATMAMLEAHRPQLAPVVFQRARHVITEIDRTRSAARAIAASDWSKVGELMYASHASLRDDYEVSCSELDAIVNISQSLGASGGIIGCRMTGAGFGGCAVALVRSDALETISAEIDTAYRTQTGREPTLFASRPAAGASLLESAD